MYKDGTGRTTVDILFSRKREVDGYPWLKGSDAIARPAKRNSRTGVLSAMLVKSVLVMLKGDIISISSVAEGGVFVRSVSQSGGPNHQCWWLDNGPGAYLPAATSPTTSASSPWRKGCCGKRKQRTCSTLGRSCSWPSRPTATSSTASSPTRSPPWRTSCTTGCATARSKCYRSTTGSNTSTCLTRSNRCPRQRSQQLTTRSSPTGRNSNAIGKARKSRKHRRSACQPACRRPSSKAGSWGN